MLLGEPEKAEINYTTQKINTKGENHRQLNRSMVITEREYKTDSNFNLPRINSRVDHVLHVESVDVENTNNTSSASKVASTKEETRN